MSQPSINLIYYLASVYSSAIPEGRIKEEVCDERHHEVSKIGLDLMKAGYVCWEPIASSYYKATNFKMPQDYTFWQERDRRMIKASDAVIVCDMPGWKESVGVTDEIEYARSLGKKIYLHKSALMFEEI